MEKSLFHATSVLAAAVCVSIFLFLHAKVYANDQTEKEYNTAFQLTEEKIQEMNNGKAVILYDENGYLSFLDGIFYDQPVRDYVMENETAQDFLKKLVDMVEFLIPNYIKEGKTQLIIGIGCTGGKHRSVTLANELYRALNQNDSYGLRIEHRDIGKDAITKAK